MTDQAPATPPATPPPAAPPAAPPAGEPAPWYGDNAEVRGLAELKGWKTPVDAAVAYQNLERLQRTPAARTLVLPEKEDDAEGWAQVHARLGRPESPTAYKLEGYEPQEGQPDLVQGDDGFLSVAHRTGLTQKQAGELYKWYTGRATGLEEQTEQQRAEAHAAAMDTVRTRWGQAYEQNAATAKQAVARLGLKQEELAAIENALGTEWLFETFHRIGKSLGEAGPLGADSPRPEGFGMSPAEAQAKINELMNDDAFTRRYLEGNPDARQRMERLHQVAAGTELVRPNSVIARR